MATDTSRQDATDSTRGTVYHLCVAVNKCYELREGQKLLIEELGDVTIEGDQQVEVKQYSGRLTDGHPNFWNTLVNWIDDKFDHTPYTALVLHTTQEFGPAATIAGWNDMSPHARLELLLAIKQSFEQQHEKAKTKDSNRTVSTVLLHQRLVLNPDKLTKLKALIGKVWIEARAKALPDLYMELKQDRIRGVLLGKKEDYLNSLIGFVCRAGKKPSERWEITYEEFEAKLGDLTATYHRETRRFPTKYFRASAVVDDSRDRVDLFVQKIRDIKYPDVIPRAIAQYEATISTLNEEFQEHRVDVETILNYISAIEDRFTADYRIACRNCSHEMMGSKDLYDKTIGSAASPFSDFVDTPDGFRNGLLHQRMNNPAADLRWRLKKK